MIDHPLHVTRISRRMISFESRCIEKGAEYPSDRFWRFISRPFASWPTFRGSVGYRFIFSEPVDGYGHIKLCGLHDVRPFCFRRVSRAFNRRVDWLGIWGAFMASLWQVPSMSHEQSTRIVACFDRAGVSLYVYEYRDGSGPATDGWSYSSRKVLFPYGEEVSIQISPSWVVFYLDRVEIDRMPVFSGAGSSLLTMQSGAHAKNGPSSPVAAGTFEWLQVRV